MRYALLALMALIALAGCNAPSGGTATDTMSPAPVTDTATTTDAPTQIAPGVTTNGITDLDALATAHREVLTGTSYTVSSRSVRFAPNGTAIGTNFDVTQFSGDGVYVRNQTATGGAPLYDLRYERISVWSNGETRFVLRVEDGERGYERQTEAPTDPLRPVPRQYIAESLADVEWTTVREVSYGDAREYYLLTGVRTESGGAFETVTVLLDERGLVHRHRTVITAEPGADIARHVVTVQYSALGETTIEPPGWLTTARNETDT